MTAERKRSGVTSVATNRRALHDYFVEQTIECGIVLTGTEVKSCARARLRRQRVVDRGEVYLLHCTSPYAGQSREPRADAPAQALLHKRIDACGRSRARGLCARAARLYFKRGKAKVALGVCKGKQVTTSATRSPSVTRIGKCALRTREKA